MWIALIHVDHSGKDVRFSNLCLEKVQRPFKVAAHLFRWKVIQILRCGRDDGVDELHTVLAYLALGVLPLGTLDAVLDLSVVFVLWLDEMVIEMGAVGVHIRVAGVSLLFPFVVFLNGGGRSAFSFLEAHNGVRHHTKLLSLKWWVCGGRGLFHIPPCHMEPAARKLL